MKVIKSFLVKYNSLSLPLKASFWFIICSVLQKGIAFIVTPLYTRILTTEQYGVYSVYQSWLSIITIFATLNLSGGVLNNSLSKCGSEKEKDNVLFNFQLLEIVLIAIVSIALFLINHFFPELFRFSMEVVILLIINILMNSSIAIWSTKSKFDYNYKPVVIVSLVASLSTALFSILLIICMQKKELALIIGAVISCIICYFWILLRNFLKGEKIDFAIWKYAVFFNLPLIPHYLSLVLLSSSDRIMIEKFSGLGAAALYAIAYNIAVVINIFSSSINSSLIPWTYKKLKNNDYFSISKRINNILIFLLIMCMIFMLFGPEGIFIMGGDKYLSAKWIIPPIAASVFFLFLYPLFGNVEFYYEKRLFTTVSSICAAIFNILLNYIFIPIYGYIAAAFTTLICYVLLSICHYIAYNIIRKQEKIPEIYDKKNLFVLSIFNLLFVCITYVLYLNFYVRYTFVLIIIIIAFIFRKKIFTILGGIR